jgi:hypothetical protein
MSNPRETLGLGRYLSQGAAANALVTYAAVVAIAAYMAGPDTLFLTIVLPFYLIVAATIGAVISGGVWMVERMCKLRSAMAARTLLVTAIGITLTLMTLLYCEDVLDFWLLTGFLAGAVLVSLPASIVAGTHFRPVRIICPQSDEKNLKPNLGSWLSALPGFVLRFISLFGFLEALLCTICLVRSLSVLSSELLIISGLATIYFAVSALVTFGTHDWHWLVTVGTLVNAPLSFWVWNQYQMPNGTQNPSPLLPLACAFIVLWGTFVIGRLMFPFDHIVRWRQRIFPVTFLEIEIRHALNRW